jgi:carboxyl-terminal processing protease
MNTAFKIVLTVLVALAIAVGSFAAGLFAATALMPKAAGSPFDGIPGMSGGSSASPHGTGGIPGASVRAGDATFDSIVKETQSYITKEALVPPTETSLTASTVDGMLKSLGDPYANYFDPKHFQYFNEQTQGSFGGIGVTLGENKKGEAYVVSVIKNTPASRAGIKKGDVFVSIDATSRPKWSSDEVVKRVRGKEGTKVTVGMRREGQAQPIKFTLTREQISVPNVESSIQGGNIGYIRLFTFNAKAADDVKTAIEELKAKGAKAFVLDLRDDPGGLLQAGVDVTSLFVKDGVVVRVDERGKPEQKYYVTGKTVTDAPLVVLVNANSASASEIAAGALQDYKRAIIVGVKSFGKGSVQSIHQLTNGGAIKFTTAHYLTPLKRVIDKKGVLPEFIIPMKEELQADPKTDTQLQKAVELLQQKVGK